MVIDQSTKPPNQRKTKWIAWDNFDQFRTLYPGWKSVAGVYVLQCNGRTIYVGQSNNVKNRVLTHVKTFEFDAIKVKRVGDRHERLWLERQLLYRIRPRKNGTLPTSLLGELRYTYKSVIRRRLSLEQKEQLRQWRQRRADRLEGQSW